MAAIPQTGPDNDASVSPKAVDDTIEPTLHPPAHASSIKEPASNASGKDRVLTAFPQDKAKALSNPLSEDASVTFQVAPVDEWVASSSPWTTGATITLTIEDGDVEVYSDSQIADVYGNFNFNLWDRFDLQRGQVVTVSDGTTTKTHTVMNLFVDGVNLTTDTVFGRADAGTSVDVWVHGDGNATATADGSGNWTADFSGQTNLTYLSDGGSQQFDEDGDSTGVWWASPRIQVAPDDNWVQSWRQWTPGANISLTIEDGGAVVYTESQVADSDGNFHFNLWNKFDLQR